MWHEKIFPTAGRVGGAVSRWIITISKWLIITTMSVIFLAIMADILVRQVFNQSIWGVEEIAILALTWLWFSAFIYTTHLREHIGGNFPIRRRLAQNIYSVVSSSLCLFSLLVFCYLAYRYCAFLIAQEARTVTLEVPEIYTVGGVFIGLVLGAGYLVRETVSNVQALRHAGKKAPNEC